MAAQEAEEEELYLAEQTKQNNQEEEELMKALAMSMEQDNKVRNHYSLLLRSIYKWLT